MDVLALAVAGVGLHAELVEQAEQLGLVRGDPLAADLQGHAVALVGPGAATDAVARLQDDDVVTGGDEVAGGVQPGRSGTDDDHVGAEFNGVHGDLRVRIDGDCLEVNRLH